MPVPPRRLKVRRPPEPRIAGARYARAMNTLFDGWVAQVHSQTDAGPLAREGLERAWAHLTSVEHLTPFFNSLALGIENDMRRYYQGMFRLPQPRPDFNRSR